jgi:hypothetical protein
VTVPYRCNPQQPVPQAGKSRTDASISMSPRSLLHGCLNPAGIRAKCSNYTYPVPKFPGFFGAPGGAHEIDGVGSGLFLSCNQDGRLHPAEIVLLFIVLAARIVAGRTRAGCMDDERKALLVLVQKERFPGDPRVLALSDFCLGNSTATPSVIACLSMGYDSAYLVWLNLKVMNPSTCLSPGRLIVSHRLTKA